MKSRTNMAAEAALKPAGQTLALYKQQMAFTWFLQSFALAFFWSNHLFCLFSAINQHPPVRLTQTRSQTLSYIQPDLCNCVKTGIIKCTTPPQQQHKQGSGGYGGQMGATAPFMKKTQLRHPLFDKSSAPFPEPNAPFFQCFVLNAKLTMALFNKKTREISWIES